MAFDVYCGTMTRFYRGDWENVCQRAAREQGIEYTVWHADGEPDAPPPAEEVRQAVTAWCWALSEGLAKHGYGPVEWDEGDGRPYFTDRPGWDGYGSLLVWAAHAEHPDLPLPRDAPRMWADDPAYQRSTVREFKSQYRTILEPQIWLPARFPFVFEGPALTSDETSIGSVFTLREQLDALQANTSQYLPELAPRIPFRIPQPKKPGLLSRLFGRRPEMPAPRSETPPLAELASLGLSVFHELVARACEHRMPMLLHF